MVVDVVINSRMNEGIKMFFINDKLLFKGIEMGL